MQLNALITCRKNAQIVITVWKCKPAGGFHFQFSSALITCSALQHAKSNSQSSISWWHPSTLLSDTPDRVNNRHNAKQNAQRNRNCRDEMLAPWTLLVGTCFRAWGLAFHAMMMIKKKANIRCVNISDLGTHPTQIVEEWWLRSTFHHLSVRSARAPRSYRWVKKASKGCCKLIRSLEHYIVRKWIGLGGAPRIGYGGRIG
jgi:hypothetical protein